MLLGETTVLREWREVDLDALAALRNNIDLQALLMSQPKPNSLVRVRTWLTNLSQQHNTVFFVIAERANEAVIGYVQVTNIDTTHGHGELGLCLSPTAHGKNLARDACALLEQYLKKSLLLRKLTLKVLADNRRAIAFYRKNGYRNVGILESHYRRGDAYYDVLVMERHLNS